MRDNSLIIHKWLHLSEQELGVFRYALSATLAMAIAMGFGWFLSFLVPVLALGFFAPGATRPNLKDGLNFILVIALACLLFFRNPKGLTGEKSMICW